jgi:hypothetical protein
MEPDPILFRDLTYIFLAAVVGGLVAWRLRLPLILGFVLGGIAISPFTPGPHVSDLHTFEVFAEVGVVLLMFSIGVEFSIPDLIRVKWVALVGAPIGILAMLGIALGVGKLAGWTLTEGLVIGAAISVASTMVLARLLRDSGSMASTHGRVMIGITLVEDLAVICMTLVLPALGGSGKDLFVNAAWTLGKAFLLLVPLGFLAIKVIPPVFRRVKATCNTELFLLIAIAVCLGTAALAQAVGFSVALGRSSRRAHPARATSRYVRGTLLRHSRDSDRSPRARQEPAAPRSDAPPYHSRQISRLDGGSVDLPLFHLDGDCRGRRADADRRTLLCGRTSRAIRWNGCRKRVQHIDRRVPDFNIA